MTLLRHFVPVFLFGTVLLGHTNAQPACRIDLAFVVDVSGGVCDKDANFDEAKDNSCDNFNRLKSFLRGVVNALATSINAGDIQVAMVTFRDSGVVRWPLSKFKDSGSILSAIDEMNYEKFGTTNIAAGLTTLRNEVFGTSADRPDAPNKAVIITDGPFPTDKKALKDIISKIHGDGVITLAVGYKNDIDNEKVRELLKLLASEAKSDKSYFKTKDFVSPGDVAGRVASQLCQNDPTPTD